MSLLTEAKLERRFRSSATNLKRLYAGYYVIELLNILTDEGDPNPELYDLADRTIRLIDSEEIPDGELNVSLLQFELKALNLLGHQPMLTKCVSCGREKTTMARVHFGLNAGGVLCQNCRRGQSDIVSLSPEGLGLLLSLVGGQIGSDQNNSDNWNLSRQAQRIEDQIESSVAVDTEVVAAKSQAELDEVRGLINSYITHLLGFTPRLHKFLKNI